LNLRLDDRLKSSVSFLLKWSFLALASALAVTPVVLGFMLAVSTSYAFLTSLPVPPPVFALLGALVTGGLIYRIEPGASGEGMPSYIRGMRLAGGRLPLSVTFYKLWSGLFTLAAFGNGGVVGPIGRVAAGLASSLAGGLRRLGLGFTDDDRRTAAFCGLAAAIGAIFHAPIGGGLFAVEIIHKERLNYSDLFPAVLAASAPYLFSRAMGWSTPYAMEPAASFMDLGVVPWLLLLAVSLGAAGGMYIRFYNLVTRVLQRGSGRILPKVLAGTLAASVAAWLIHPGLLGTSTPLLRSLLTGDAGALVAFFPLRDAFLPLWLALLILMLGKAACNCITVGTGMSAGFTGPSILIGFLLAALFAGLAGAEPGGPTYSAFLAAGMAGMLAGAMNIPLAGAVMAVEIFGIHCSLPAALAAVVAFQVNRHQTLYDFTLAQVEREESGGSG